MEDFEELLSYVVVRTREKIKKAVDGDVGKGLEGQQSSLTKTFAGCCGLAQCIAGYFLQDRNISVQAVATQSLPNWRFGHAVLSVSVCEGACERTYIVDPTFIQFCDDGNRLRSDILPGSFKPLFNDKTVSDLVHKGFIELDQKVAAAYVNFFCLGAETFQTDQECLDFLRNPPSHPYHFSAGDGTNRFSRKELGQQNLMLS